MAVPSGGRWPTGGWRRRTFASLIASGNYRRFVVGQAISLVGTWMQTIGQSWLVLQLTGSATTLGLVAAVQSCYCPHTLGYSSTEEASVACSWRPRR